MCSCFDILDAVAYIARSKMLMIITLLRLSVRSMTITLPMLHMLIEIPHGKAQAVVVISIDSSLRSRLAMTCSSIF